MSKIKELLRVGDEEIGRVRKLYEKTEEEIEEDVNMLLDWLKKQPHLPKSHDRDRLERFLVRNKFRIERTKIKLDNYYAFKVLYPEFYPPHLNPESDAMKALKKSLIIVPMPKLLPNLERLYFCKFVEGQDQQYNFLHQVQYMIMLWEMQLSHDYSSAEILLWDLRHMTFKHVLKFDLNLMKKGFAIFRQAFSARVARVIYINVGSSVFDVSLGILKRVTDSKLFAKIRVLKDAEALQEFIPREYLPEEVEGTAGSVKDLSDEWDKEMIHQEKFLELQASRVSDERLRVGEPLHLDDLFGIEGTFRKINLD